MVFQSDAGKSSSEDMQIDSESISGENEPVKLTVNSSTQDTGNTGLVDEAGGLAPETGSESDSELYDDNDSAIAGLDDRSSTISVRSSLHEAVVEHGRTYHAYKQGKYPLPNDEQEQDRLDLQHKLFLLTLHGKLHLAPIGDTPHNVLDIATGTGLWAIDFADLYPSANVLGNDLSAIQPTFTPPNCRFEIDDVEEEWTFSQKFDFIHGRALVSCFRDPASVIRKAFGALAPGGYLELQDVICPAQYLGDPPKDSSIFKWNELVVSATEKSGRPWTNVQYYSRWMRDAGFVDIEEKRYHWPINPWPKNKHLKNLSVWVQQDILNVLEGMSLKLFTHYLGWSPEEIQVLLAGVRKDIKDPSIRAYCPVVVVYGRKPGQA